MKARQSLVLLGLVGVVAASLLVSRLLVEYDWNPSTTIKFGEAFPEQNAYAEELLGPIVVAPQAGHDGKFFFSQAMDPFYLEPEIHAIYLDRPSYRAQRMLYPTVASLGGVLEATPSAWGLIVVNVLAMGTGTAFTALVAIEMGLSRWFGLAFLLNPGLIVVLFIDGAGILAFAGLMAAVYFVLKDRLWPAAGFLTIAVLSRETMLIGAAGLALFVLWKQRRVPWILAYPVVAVGVWWLYVHWRLQEGLAQDTQALGLPFVGFFEAFGRWLDTPGSTIDLLIGTILIVISLAVLVRSVRSPTALGWAVGGFALLGIMLSEPVWFRYFDSSRALAPVLTAYLLLVPASIKVERADSDRESIQSSVVPDH